MANRFLLCLFMPLLCGAALRAAVIRGAVAEQSSGRMLSRASVALKPVHGTPGDPRTVRTNSYGQFEFDSLAAGAYVITASRRGFMTMAHGQRRWNSAGVPLVVTADASPFITLRLPRFPGITGTVVDENDVGMPDMEVVAYRATQPPELAARAVSDDRGVFRIPGLVPGTYLVRSSAGRGEFLDYLPTFSRETLRLSEARQVAVFLDDDARNADVRPMPGKLFRLSGAVRPERLPVGPVTVTLASEMGRQAVQGLTFEFPGLAPGPYELTAEARPGPGSGAEYQSGYARLSIGGDTQATVVLSRNLTQFDGSPVPAGNSSVRVRARRVDLAGVGPSGEVTLENNRARLALGRWEVMILPPPGQYVSWFTSASQPSVPRGRPDGWNEIEVRAWSAVRYTFSAGASVVAGMVKHGGDPVAGVPVHLEAYDPANRKRLMALQSVRTGMRGDYRFEGLAPGTYRLLATFEYQSPEAADMEQAGARAIRLEAKGNAAADLALYELP